jgi:hypothetical protein
MDSRLPLSVEPNLHTVKGTLFLDTGGGESGGECPKRLAKKNSSTTQKQQTPPQPQKTKKAARSFLGKAKRILFDLSFISSGSL